ncbi:hypothetical protein COK29_26795, partial [Bacillus cereus]
MSEYCTKQDGDIAARFVSVADSIIAVPVDIQYNSVETSYSQQVMASVPVIKDTTTDWYKMIRKDGHGNDIGAYGAISFTVTAQDTAASIKATVQWSNDGQATHATETTISGTGSIKGTFPKAA